MIKHKTLLSESKEALLEGTVRVGSKLCLSSGGGYARTAQWQAASTLQHFLRVISISLYCLSHSAENPTSSCQEKIYFKTRY